MRQMTEAQAEAEHAAAIEAEDHAACWTIREVAAFLHLHRESVRGMVTRRGLGHRAPRHPGRTGTIHLTLLDIGEGYPRLVRRRPARARPTMSREEHQAEYPETIQPGSPEWDAAIERMRADRS